MKVFFKTVTVVKPNSSRDASLGISPTSALAVYILTSSSSSLIYSLVFYPLALLSFAESFILCQNYSPPPSFVPIMIDFSLPNYGVYHLVFLFYFYVFLFMVLLFYIILLFFEVLMEFRSAEYYQC